MLLAQLLLRPIHVIRSGLTRLGRGELGVRLDLSQDDEFGELGTFFNTVSAQLSADRSQMAGQVANLESAVEHLEDAVAIVSPRGELLFANPAMRALLPDAAPGTSLEHLVGADHPLRGLSEQTLVEPRVARAGVGDVSRFAGRIARAADHDARGQRSGRRSRGVMLIARDLSYLSQVQSTIRYSRKLAALGRLSAGVAHEVKNPLNAMMIHLELLRQQFASRAGGRRAERRRRGAARRRPWLRRRRRRGRCHRYHQALEHVDVIADEIHRLDEVVQGFLKFSRPEDLKLQPVNLAALLDEVVPIVRPEAERAGVELVVDPVRRARRQRRSGDAAAGVSEPGVERLSGDAGGGTLRIRCESARGHLVAISFTDTGVGIKPEHLQRIFDLISRRRRRAAASACRWCIARFRCTTARLRYSRHQGRARRSASSCRRHDHG